MKLLKTTALGLLAFITVSSSYSATTDETLLNGFTDFNSSQYYLDHASDVTPIANDWFEYVKVNYQDQSKDLAGLRYYLRLRPMTKAQLDAIDQDNINAAGNPDNVKLLMNLVSHNDYVTAFPNAKDGKPCSYLNLLKSVALMPGLFSDFSDFTTLTNLPKTDEMEHPELVWRRFLAATLAHGIQETSNSGGGIYDNKSGKWLVWPTLDEKLSGIFGTIEEGPNTSYTYSVAKNEPGIWGENGFWGKAAMKDPNGNWDLPPTGSSDPVNCTLYGGKGIHQITYQYNYANISLFLYQDLRLIKYPKLIASKSILPWLTTLTYSAIPKAYCPSIIEVFDGQWQKHLKDVNASPTDSANYSNPFPMTVLLINGLECGPEAVKRNTEQANTQYDTSNNTFIRCQAYNSFDTGTKKLISGTDSITAPTLQDCYNIDMDYLAGPFSTIAWKRPFLVTANKKLVSEASNYYIFGGKGTITFLDGPKDTFAYHSYYIPSETINSFEDIKDLVDSDPGKANHPERKVALTQAQYDEMLYKDGSSYNAGNYVTYNNQLWYVDWGCSGTPQTTDPCYNSPWRIAAGTVVIDGTTAPSGSGTTGTTGTSTTGNNSSSTNTTTTTTTPTTTTTTPVDPTPKSDDTKNTTTSGDVPAWSSDHAYSAGDNVTYNAVEYVCKTATDKGSGAPVPGTSAWYWEKAQ